jgi:ABC-2 type transport system ATP-binding protein
VSLQVAAGEIVGLLGANGAGKTTLIRVLLGLLAPSEGTSTLMGGQPDRQHRRGLGYVPQGLGLYADLTVAENVAFVATMYGAGVPPLPESLVAAADRPVGDLSLGQQRRLAFTCALLHDPEVLVLDEPTSGVSATTSAALWDIIHEQSARGVGILVTTHNMQEAQQCDRLLLMSRGALVGEGSEADIIGDIRAVAVTAPNWSAAFDALNDAGQPVTLAGRRVRVADGDPDRIRQILASGGVAAEVDIVPATIEERMTLLARADTG